MLIDEIKQKIEHTLWNIEDNDPLKAQKIYTECLSVLKEQDNNSSNINLCSFCYLRIANCLLLTKNIESAELNVELSLKLAKKIDDAISINRANLFKASVLKSSGKCDEALDILQEIENNLDECESFDAKQIVGWSNIAASTILMEGKHDLKKALSLSDRAIQILEPINNEAGLLRAYQINYVIHKYWENFTESDKYFALLNKND